MALDLAHSARPDVLILDIGMPQLNGLEVARRIREKLGPVPRLIAVTGWGTQQDRIETQQAGFNAHFVKPVKWNELETLLNTYLAAAVN